MPVVMAFHAVDMAVIGPPLLVGLLILASAAPLGLIIARRRGPFTSLALAQTASCGLTAGTMLWGAPNVLVIEITGLVAVLACAGGLALLAQRARGPEVAAGAVFAMAASLQLVLLAHAVDAAVQVNALLVGRVLTISPQLLVGTILLACAALMIWWLQETIRTPVVFHLLLAVVVFVAVQIAGLLVTLIVVTVPAAAASRAPLSWQPLIAFNIGVIGYALGLVAAAMLGTPAGPTIVCVTVPMAALAYQMIALTAPDGRARPTG
jgi:ABC-type Mn2+/Zn2+ transport system permease subunit